VVDDRVLIAEALAVLLRTTGRFTVTSRTVSTADPASIAASGPALVLIGAGATPAPVVSFVGALHALSPGLPAVIVADSQDANLIRCVLDEGVGAVVLSTADGEDLILAIDQVLRGHTALPAGWQDTLTGDGDGALTGLSRRQLEVLGLLADGRSYQQISERLFISLNTVKYHVRTIYERLGVRNRLAAVRIFERSAAAVARENSRASAHRFD
jgi:DNA-binding NarL/FixJ family response regulator